VLKPLGPFGSQLAQLTYGFARAGVDLIKDDHSLADQTSAPFAERVERCQEAVVRANDETGGNALYFPNVTSDPSEMMARAGAARRAGCRGVLVNALPAGLGAVGEIAATTGLAIMSHPALAGAFSGRITASRPKCCWESCSGSPERCRDLSQRRGAVYVLGGDLRGHQRALRAPLGPVAPAFPAPGGGIDAARVPQWIERYGADTIFLIGGSLYAQPDPIALQDRWSRR